MRAARFVSLICCLVLSACATPQKQKSAAATKPAERVLTAEERQQNIESFDMVWTTIRDKHFDPKLNGADWDAAREELRPKVENATTMSEARGAMSELLHRLNQTHFGIIPKSAYALMSKGSGANGESGIDLRVLDGHAIVTSVEPGSGGVQAGVKPGWELVSARGEAVAPAIAKVAAGIGDSTMKGAMLQRAAISQLRGGVGDHVPAQFIDGSGRTVSVDLVLKEPTGEPFKFGSMPNFYVHYDSKRLPSPDERIGYISISAFMLPSIVQQFRKSVESFQNTDGLIIDLRGNPGGIGGMAMGIGNLLTQQRDQKLGTMQMRSQTLKFVLNPQAVTYAKPVVVLVDECSASTSEILAQGLRDIGRARVIGTPTAGAALPSVVVELPNGDGFQYAIASYTSSGGMSLEGKGVQPDELVRLDRKSLLAGHDPQVDAAVNWIRSQQNKK